MPTKTSILFLCTGNCCRSQMAEALLHHLGGGRFEALSAGSHPAGFIHDLAIEAMHQLQVPLADQHSKSWDEFADSSLDAVITLCDAAAGQTCPNWPSSTIYAHWSLPDPAMHLGESSARMQLAISVAKRLSTKIEALVEIDWSGNKANILERLQFLGEI